MSESTDAPDKTPDVLAEIEAQQVASRKRLDDEHAKIVAALAECRARELELIARRDKIDKARREMRPRKPRGTKKTTERAEGGGADE